MSQQPAANPDAIAKRIASGLGRIALALKAKAWKGAADEGITPTQGEVLARLAEATSGMRLSDLAHQLGVSAPTASDAVSTLVDKALVEKRSGEDKRSVTLKLTREGKRTAARAADWPDFWWQQLQHLQTMSAANFWWRWSKSSVPCKKAEVFPRNACV
jgi:DNA-binding MarR family transcriptional regulator